MIRRVLETIAERQRRRSFEKEPWQWFLLAGPRERAALTDPDPSSLRPIYPPPDRFWADPFVWVHDGQHYLFFEDYPYATRKGFISVMPVSGEGVPLAAARPVIECGVHLSYPFLFEVDGALYMIPEKKAQRRVDLYRCLRFPDQWVVERTLFKGRKMVDVTVFPFEGHWWLFASLKEKGLRYDESLVAFYTDHPLKGEWRPHAENPIVRDYARGRSAGGVQQAVDGSLLRPSQDCSQHYGGGLNLLRIETLSPSHYQERRIWHRSGVAAGGWRGMHHLDWREGLMVMDAQRKRPESDPVTSGP